MSHQQGRIVDASKLWQVTTAKLKDGADVIVHKFVGEASCWQGSAASSTAVHYAFKSYAAFDGGPGVGEYRKWEPMAGNHSASSRYDEWNRSSELLK